VNPADSAIFTGPDRFLEFLLRDHSRERCAADNWISRPTDRTRGQVRALPFFAVSA